MGIRSSDYLLACRLCVHHHRPNSRSASSDMDPDHTADQNATSVMTDRIPDCARYSGGGHDGPPLVNHTAPIPHRKIVAAPTAPTRSPRRFAGDSLRHAPAHCRLMPSPPPPPPPPPHPWPRARCGAATRETSLASRRGRPRSTCRPPCTGTALPPPPLCRSARRLRRQDYDGRTCSRPSRHINKTCRPPSPQCRARTGRTAPCRAS